MSWNEKTKARAKELIDQHWKYHDVLLAAILIDEDPEIIQKGKKWGELYKQIGIHFYKHAIEDMEEERLQFNK